MKTMSIIGCGNFGRLMVEQLKPYFTISINRRRNLAETARELDVEAVTIPEAGKRDIIMLSVPAQHIEVVLKEMAPTVRPGALVLDVASVKMHPVRLMEQLLPAHAEILGTHPLFGPQSAVNGIAGLKIVLCPVRTERMDSIRSFCAETLGLRVFEVTPEDHDRQMAFVQGLNHFIMRAVGEMNLPHSELATPAYQRLLDMKHFVDRDTLDLFFTIQRENDFARDVREQFLASLMRVRDMIG